MIARLRILFHSARAKAEAELDAACAAYEAALAHSREVRRRGDARSIGPALRALKDANHRRLMAERKCMGRG